MSHKRSSREATAEIEIGLERKHQSIESHRPTPSLEKRNKIKNEPEREKDIALEKGCLLSELCRVLAPVSYGYHAEARK